MYIPNEQNTAISKHFTKLAEYTHTTSRTIFIADLWISCSQVIFHYKTWGILLEVFVSKNQ